MKRAEPKATRKWVRNPASFERYSRSNPMIPPNTAAMVILKMKSVVIDIGVDFYEFCFLGMNNERRMLTVNTETMTNSDHIASIST